MAELKPVFTIATNDLETAKQVAMWGTNGPGGLEHCRGTCSEHRIRWVKLIDCETDHLLAILRLPHVRGGDYDLIIRAILADRGVDAETSQNQSQPGTGGTTPTR